MDAIKEILYDKDIKGILFLNTRIKCRLLDRVFLAATWIGSAAGTIMICLLMIGSGDVFVVHIGVQALMVVAVSHLFIQLLKKIVTRKRPVDVLTGINMFNIPLDRYSFPSGHTTAIFAITTTALLYCPDLAILLLPVAILVGLSRVYLGVHYPSDVIAGAVVAAATSFSFYYLLI